MSTLDIDKAIDELLGHRKFSSGYGLIGIDCAIGTLKEAGRRLVNQRESLESLQKKLDATNSALDYAVERKAEIAAQLDNAVEHCGRANVRAEHAEDERDHLLGEIDGLATALLKEFGGPTCDESACEMAVRLLRRYREALERIEAMTTKPAPVLRCLRFGRPVTDAERLEAIFRPFEDVAADCPGCAEINRTAEMSEEDSPSANREGSAPVNDRSAGVNVDHPWLHVFLEIGSRAR